MSNDIREEVRQTYARAAIAVIEDNSACCTPTSATASCCEPASSSCCGDDAIFGNALYETLQKQELPDAAVMASLGCGNPTAVADLKEGDVVLDLGSGGGIDVLLSAKRVGSTGMAYGLDMTDEMLELARRNQAESGLTNVEFIKGHIEDIPLPNASVDVIISNCVINLSADKPSVFSQMSRVLKSGGRVGVSDVVADDALTTEERAERGSFVGCIAGALSFGEYADLLEANGFTDISVTSTHEVAPQMYSAIVKATKV